MPSGRRELDVLQQLAHVEDQRHGAVAEDRGAGEPAHLAEESPEGLDHGLLPADHVVDDEADALPVRLGDHDLLARGGVAGHAEPVPQPDERDQLAADLREAALPPVVAGAAHELDALLDDGERQDQVLVAEHDLEALDDRERQRDPDLERRPLAGRLSTCDLAAQVLHRALDDVEAHPAPGDLRDRRARREPGEEEQLVQLALGPVSLSRDQPAVHGLAPHGRRVDPRAVVLDADHHVRPGVRGAQAHRAVRRLAGAGALGRRLDAVVDAVAQQVDDRVVEPVDDVLVQLGVIRRSVDHLDVAADIVREVADQAAELAEGRADRHHAHAQAVVAQLGGQALDRLGDADQLRVGPQRGQQRQARLHRDQLADEVDQLVELGRADAQRGHPLARLLQRGRRDGGALVVLLLRRGVRRRRARGGGRGRRARARCATAGSGGGRGVAAGSAAGGRRRRAGEISTAASPPTKMKASRISSRGRSVVSRISHER